MSTPYLLIGRLLAGLSERIQLRRVSDSLVETADAACRERLLRRSGEYKQILPLSGARQATTRKTNHLAREVARADMDHRLALQTCCELIDVIIKRNPYMHPIGQNRGPFALSIMIGPAAISITDDDCVPSILILTRRKRVLMSLRSNS